MTRDSLSGRPVRLRNDSWEVYVEPESLRVVGRPRGRSEIELSAAQPRFGRAANLKHTDNQLSWDLVDSNVHVAFRLVGETLSAEITSSAPGSFTWPVIAPPPIGAAYVLPLAEGSYVPPDDSRWLGYLVERSPMKALESFSMPFWGLALPDWSVTYLLTNQFNNEIAFADHGGRIGFSLTHRFTANRERKEYGVLIRLAGGSPVEPARRYRSWLEEQGQFVSMRSKIEQTPEAGKLLGAPHVYLWADGISASMIEKLADLGCERLWLGLSSCRSAFDRPEAIRSAKERGYLIGTYDSYHSIHQPEEGDSWETAHFDLELYEKGPILGADGAKLPGYLGKGYLLSPIAAWPYVKERVTRLMSELPESLNSWFIDCDAYGEVFDDYSELHPATQEDDVKARLHRMAWIRDAYGLVIGSEGGAAYSAATIHFAHGMMTPVFGWGDPELQKDQTSQYYLGGWSSHDGPSILLKRVPLKPRYRTFHYDPRFRLPLYQTVFHDSVVATHHWHHSSLKFTDQVETVELLELLYNVPPLYHLNSAELARHGNRIAEHNTFFSPLHRELGLLPLTDFAWLTTDRMVQRTVLGDKVEMVANFTDKPFEDSGPAVPGRSVLARWLGTGATSVYTPPPSSA
jgi:hypothetical protein